MKQAMELGGGVILRRRLKVSDEQHSEVQPLKEHIMSFFQAYPAA
jgi:hypothetical protein